MRPRNAREREVIALYERHYDLSPAQKKWIAQEVVEKRIYTSGKKCWCTDCGQEWTEKIEGEEAVCPHCGAKAKVVKGRHTVYKDFYYAQFFHIYEGWQVIRYTLVRWECRKGKKPEITLQDVIQKWCQPGRPMITLGCALGMMTCYRAIPYSLWDCTLTIKPNHGYWYSEWMKHKTYPRMSLLPVYVKHIGKSPDWENLDLYAPTLIGDIFGCPYLEKLWKEDQWDELMEMRHYTDELNKYWPSVKVALRHGFKPEHWISYFDYLKALKFLRYDMLSPRYVAPPDWNEIHDLVMRQYKNKTEAMARKRAEAIAIRNALAEEERLRLQEEEARKSAKSFARRIAKFEGLEIKDADIVISPLMSIEAFRDEGDAMHHCVFALGYYKKKDSLILSARTRREGKRLETIEVDIKDFKILQSMGIYNTPTDKHDEILGLVNGAMSRIRAMAV